MAAEEMEMEVTSRFGALTEIDIGGVAKTIGKEERITNKRARTLSSGDSTQSDMPNGPFIAHFPFVTRLHTPGYKFRWVQKALKMEPYKHIKDSLVMHRG